MQRLLVIVWTISATASLGAVCVTSVEQKGDAGPWVGEVVNSGQAPVVPVVQSQITDANGDPAQLRRARFVSCPRTLLPAEHGSFELSVELDETTTSESSLPFRAAFEAAESDLVENRMFSEGLFVQFIDKDLVRRSVRVAVRNNSERSYWQLHTCGVLRNSDGDVVGVAGFPPFNFPEDPPPLLEPGETEFVELTFNSVPVGSLRLYAVGSSWPPQQPCCSAGPLAIQAVDGKTFRVMTPPGWEIATAIEDAYAGTLFGGDIQLDFEHAPCFGRTPPVAPGHTIVDESIGGFHAQIVRPRDSGSDVTGVYFRHDLTFDGGPTCFSLSARGLSSEQQQIVLEVFRSLRFDG